jgi:hypothetical protein
MFDIYFWSCFFKSYLVTVAIGDSGDRWYSGDSGDSGDSSDDSGDSGDR